MEAQDTPKSGPVETPPPVNFRERRVMDYIFEFFMLFLAVTLGFFVNNLSNNLSERRIEKEYMVSLVNDLKTDTSSIRQISENMRIRMAGIDTLIRMIRDPLTMADGSMFYKLSNRYMNYAEFFTSNDRTISQLKFSGGMRLISKTEVSDSIISYYGFSDNVRYNTDYCLDEFSKILDLRKELISCRYLTQSIPDKMETVETGFIINDPVRYNRLCNEIVFYYSLLYTYDQSINNLKDQAGSLMAFIDKSYRLK